MILLDLDNCVADDQHRLKLIRRDRPTNFERFHAYHVVSYLDQCGNHDIWMDRDDIIVLTARPEFYRALTLEWIWRVGVRPYRVIMRPDSSDFAAEGSAEFKSRIAAGLLRGGWHIDHGYDDRQDVIDEYHKLGIPATRRFIHNEDWA